MLQHVTRLTTPASLIVGDDEDNFSDATDPQLYREMHGYIPEPLCPQREPFEKVASREQLNFVVRFGVPAAFSNNSGDFVVRIDMLSQKAASDELLESFVATASQLFDGQLAEDICVSSGGACGIGIVCCDPDSVTVERLTVDCLMNEFLTETRSLLAVPANVNVEERASFFSAVCWLQYSLEHMLTGQSYKRIQAVMAILGKCYNRVARDDEKTAVFKLIQELER